MKIYLIKILLFIVFLFFSKAQELPDTHPLTGGYVQLKATVKVIGEDGAPITGADVHVRVLNLERYKDGSNDFTGVTNEKGEFTVESNTSDSFIPITVKKEGYHASETRYDYPYELNKTIKNHEKLQPWNPTVPVILKKKGKGAPMYVREMRSTFLPTQHEAHGFDLMEGDWVEPYGKGKVDDLRIRGQMDVVDDDNYDSSMVITFPNKGDGWIALHELHGIESEMKYPRDAPLGGYSSEPIQLTYRWRKPFDNPPLIGGNPYGYILRLRTQYEKDGSIHSAIYAKIIDDKLQLPVDTRRLENPIYFGSGPKLMKEKGHESGCYFKMDYYLNPKPNDRTLEYDRKTNLAPDSQRHPSVFLP
jgi:hypothetical protein